MHNQEEMSLKAKTPFLRLLIVSLKSEAETGETETKTESLDVERIKLVLKLNKLSTAWRHLASSIFGENEDSLPSRISAVLTAIYPEEIQPSRNYLNLHDFELTILQAEEIFDRLEEIALSTSLDLQPVRQLIHKYTLGLYRTMGEARRYFRNPDDEQQLQYIEAMLINWINETTEYRP